MDTKARSLLASDLYYILIFITNIIIPKQTDVNSHMQTNFLQELEAADMDLHVQKIHGEQKFAGSLLFT